MITIILQYQKRIKTKENIIKRIKTVDYQIKQFRLHFHDLIGIYCESSTNLKYIKVIVIRIITIQKIIN